MTRTLTLLVVTFLSSAVACVQQKSEWKDPAKHTVRFVTVEPNVRLEVLDWGGSGQPVVLLAGHGNSAHVFDEFAEKLTETNRVYGVTRRGFGRSSHPDSGYGMERLAADILKVLDSLQIVSPVLVGRGRLPGQRLRARPSPVLRTATRWSGCAPLPV
jgi:alpha/beta hydrolase family protein